jgi:hypothetical protein
VCRSRRPVDTRRFPDRQRRRDEKIATTLTGGFGLIDRIAASAIFVMRRLWTASGATGLPVATVVATVWVSARHDAT